MPSSVVATGRSVPAWVVALVGILVASILTVVGALAGGTAAARPERPDIIIVYIDDVPPLDGRWWTATRTPQIHRYIVDRGLTFRNAVAESPLCCPARANLLSGLHTHNNHVIRNEAALFDPTVTIATELHDAGYHTAWIGKYLNRYMSLRGETRRAHESGWDTFEPMSGGSYGYYHWPKGDPAYRRPPGHSMDRVQALAVAELAGAPPDQPLFAVLATYAGHYPNDALPRFKGSSRCASMRRWKPANYGRASANGKPLWVQRRAARRAAHVPAAGYPLTRICEDMLGVDELVGKVVRTQRARGRLTNTLLVLMSDNGYTLGEFGMLDKHLPYATPVVLSMAWPRVMGTTRRTTAYPTSNIDLAPTLCDIAGCEMGPYPEGQAHADGISILPVMTGGDPEPRGELLTVMFQKNTTMGMPAWTAVTTYRGNPLGRWHYIRYETGQRELYDLSADPHELRNLAPDPAYAHIKAALEQRRRALLLEGVALPSPWASPTPIESSVPKRGS